MEPISSTKWLIIVLVTVLAVVVCAGTPPALKPAQAKTDENWIFPETISTGSIHTCGVKSDGTLICWGDGGGASTPPEGTFTQVSAGFYYNCGLKSDGTLACWGENGWSSIHTT